MHTLYILYTFLVYFSTESNGERLSRLVPGTK